MRRTVLAVRAFAIAAAVLILAACAGTSSTGPSSSWTPATLTPPPSRAGPSTPAPATTKAVKLPEPCKAVTPAQVSKIMGKTYAGANATTVSGSKVCTYVGSMESPSVISQVQPLATSLSDLNKEATKVFADATTVGTDVDGADQALITIGTVSSAPAVLVAFAHEHVYSMVMVIAPSGDYSAQALKIAALLAKAEQ